MVVEKCRSTGTLKETNFRYMTSNIKRTCLSAESSLSSRHVEEVPLGAKLPMIPGNRLVLCTTQLCEKLHLPSCDFDRTYPSDVYITNEYRCLHDHHLKHYFADRPRMVQRLRKKGFITKEGKVRCSLKEYNLYQQYLKHLSVEFYNQKYLEQYNKELKENKNKNKEAILQKQKDPKNPITVRLDRARLVRQELESKRKAVGRKLVREARLSLKQREQDKKEKNLRSIIREEIREEKREKKKIFDIILEEEKNIVREEILRQKHREEIHRRLMFEQRKMKERKIRQQILIEKYERKKEFHSKKLKRLEQMLAVEEFNRKQRIEAWEKYFTTKWRQQYNSFTARLVKDRQEREDLGNLVSKRLQRRGWTGAPWRGQRFDVKQECNVALKANDKGKGDGKPSAIDIKMLRQLSAMGFHNVMIAPEMFKVMNLENGEDTADDLLSIDSVELWLMAKDLVDRVVDISINVLCPMLTLYESKTGVKIGSTLHDLCEGVFDEELDDLARLLHFENLDGKATIASGKQNSCVRFIVSNSDLPLDLHRQNRPPTPKSSRLYWNKASQSESQRMICELSQKVLRRTYEECGLQCPKQFLSDTNVGKVSFFSPEDSQILLDQTIQSLAQKIVRRVCTESNNYLQNIDMEKKLAELATSIVGDIVAFGIQQTRPVSSSSSVSNCSKTSQISLEEKISHLARRLISDMIGEEESSSTSQSVTTHSSLSYLALKVVRSLMSKIDHYSGKTLQEQIQITEEVENRIKLLCEEIVDDILKEQKSKLVFENQKQLQSNELAEIEEKLSKLALNFTNSAMKGENRPCSSRSSIDSLEMEEQVSEMTTGIVRGILGLKNVLSRTPEPIQPSKHAVKNAEDMTAIDFIRSIFNLEALQKAPKGLLQNLNQSDIENISSELTSNLVPPPRDDSSLMSSGISNLAAVIADQALENVANQKSSLASSAQYQETRHTSSSSHVDSGVSILAEAAVVDGIFAAQQDVGSSTISAASSGIRNIAQKLTDQTLNFGLIESSVDSNFNKKVSTENSSFTSGASDVLADMLVKGVISKLKQSCSADKMALDSPELLHAIESYVHVTLDKKKKEISAVAKNVHDIDEKSFSQHLKSNSTSNSEETLKAVKSVATQCLRTILGIDVQNGSQLMSLDTIQFDAEENDTTLDKAADQLSRVINDASSQLIPKRQNKKRKTKPTSKMASTGSLPSGTQKLYLKSSFNDFRVVHESEEANKKEKKGKGDLMTSTEAMNDVLENLAERIVRASIQVENENVQTEATTALSTSNSVYQLVACLALGLVTSLLGLDGSIPTEAMSSVGDNEPNEVSSEAPRPSAYTRPTSPTKKKRRGSANKKKEKKKALEKEEQEQLLKILRAEDVAKKPRSWMKDTSPCIDNAYDHPHRIPSPRANSRHAAIVKIPQALLQNNYNGGIERKLKQSDIEVSGFKRLPQISSSPPLNVMQNSERQKRAIRINPKRKNSSDVNNFPRLKTT